MSRYRYILAVLCLLASMAAHAQTNISGVVNRYTAATFVGKCNGLHCGAQLLRLCRQWMRE
ncbi:MAG: hypothetical protein JST22_07870 [Bacteroidetes bacterium]|nr:hypothetical protein [Bacteroidota bacterium]